MISRLTILACFGLFLYSCSTNPVTGRSQLHLLPESELQTMALQQYKQFLSTNQVVSSNARDAEMVKRVGNRVANAVTRYFESKGLAKQLEGYQWEFNLVENKEANAWCMPGGKVVVYTGLLPITRSDDALAFVLGHEISHAILQHGNERMSQQLGAQVVGAGLQVALSNRPSETQNAFLAAYGLGSQVGVLLPFSRKQEAEADHYGLIWAAMAGFNPQEAIPFWQRMESATQGQASPAFLSDHPSTGDRIQSLQSYMPEAMKYYKK